MGPESGMTEVWVAVALAVVIVVGMTVTRVWEALIAKGTPVLASMLARDATDRADREPERIADLHRRIERLDERVEFLERLLEARSGSNHDPP